MHISLIAGSKDGDTYNRLSTALGVAHRIGIPVEINAVMVHCGEARCDEPCKERRVTVRPLRWDEVLAEHNLLQLEEFHSGGCAWAPAKTCCALTFSDVPKAWCRTCQARVLMNGGVDLPRPNHTSAVQHLRDAVVSLQQAARMASEEVRRNDINVLRMYAENMVQLVEAGK